MKKRPSLPMPRCVWDKSEMNGFWKKFYRGRVRRYGKELCRKGLAD